MHAHDKMRCTSWVHVKTMLTPCFNMLIPLLAHLAIFLTRPTPFLTQYRVKSMLKRVLKRETLPKCGGQVESPS